MNAKLAIAALVAATLGVGAISAFAQDSGSTSGMPAAMSGQRPMHGMMNGPQGHGPGMKGRGMGGLLMLSCSDRGAEEVDVGFTRLAHRVGDLTADQQKLFDALREQALTNATTFSDTCQAAMPERGAGTQPDMLTRMKAGIAIEEAHLAALKAVLPAFEAFYNSLTDAQKAALMQGGPHGPNGRMIDKGARGRMLPPPADDAAPGDGAGNG